MRRTAEIAGAGLSGLLLATRLAQLGWQVRLHERNPDLRMFGAGIWIWESGLRALEVVGAYDQAVARARTIAEWRIADHNGRPLMSRYTTASDRLLLPPRADLYEALITQAEHFGVDIQTSSTAVSVTGDGVLQMLDGTELKADLVVAADGAYSRLRESILATGWVDYGVEAGIRMMIDRKDDDPDDTIIEYWHGRRRLLYNPCTEGQDYIFLSAPPVDDKRASAMPVDRDLWSAAFPQRGPSRRTVRGSQSMGPAGQRALPALVAGGARRDHRRRSTRDASESRAGRQHRVHQRHGTGDGPRGRIRHPPHRATALGEGVPGAVRPRPMVVVSLRLRGFQVPPSGSTRCAPGCCARCRAPRSSRTDSTKAHARYPRAQDRPGPALMSIKVAFSTTYSGGLQVKFASFLGPTGIVAGVVRGAAVVPLDGGDSVDWAGQPTGLLQHIGGGREAITTGTEVPLDSVELVAPPIPVPRRNIICVGQNYVEHSIEFDKSGFNATAGKGIPDRPVVFFTKAPTTVIGPEQEIPPRTTS